MTTPARPWGVDSYHVNVGTGDCSVHVLVCQPDAVNKTDRKACRCVLIDGGSVINKLNPQTGIEDDPIQRTVQWLSGQYTWEDNQCRFDSIVITHWDEDHYAGILQAIQKDAANGKIPYIKYNPTATDNDPATYLYCSNWTKNGFTRLNGAPAKWVKREGGLVYINIHYTRSGSSDPSPNDWISFCRLRTAEDDLSDVLGVEFFSNNKCQSRPFQPSQVTSLDLLVQCNRPVRPSGLQDTPTPPQMLCLSTQNYILGQPLRVVTEPLTKTNRWSIVCIVYWSDTGRISHYLAGDLNQVTEGKILRWIDNGGRHGCRITSIKLSHHGARSSTPLNMMLAALPYNILISNPSARHIHPAWETILYLWLYAMHWRTPQGQLPRVLATKYPHYFVYKQSSSSGSGLAVGLPSHFHLRTFKESEGKTGTYAAFRRYVESVRSRINADLTNGYCLPCEFDQYFYKKKVERKSDDEIRNWLLDLVVKQWQDVGYPGPECHPAIGVVHRFPQLQMLTRNNSIDFILVKCRNDQDDGEVQHKYYNSTDMRAYYRAKFIRIEVLPLTAIQAAGATQVVYLSTPTGGQVIAPVAAAPDDFTDVVVDDDDDVVMGEDPEQESDEYEPFPVDRKCPPQLSAERPAGINSDNIGYYLFASDVLSQQIQVSTAQYHSLLPGTPIDNFVTSLHCKCLCLQGPNPPQAGSSIRLLETDEFGGYLMQSLRAQECSIIAAEGQSIAGFSFGLVLPSTTMPESTVSGQGNALLYTTDALQDAFDPDPAPSAPGLIPSNILILGLDTRTWPKTGTTVSITLAELAQYVEAQYLVESCPALIALARFSVRLILSKGNTTGRRNAVWFEPRNSYRATIRLQFDLEDVATLQNYLGRVFKGLIIKNASVIAKKISVWSAAPKVNDQFSAWVTYSSSMAFQAECSLSGVVLDTMIYLDPSQIKLALTVQKGQANPLQAILTFLGSLPGLQDNKFEFRNWLQNVTGNVSFDPPVLRRIEMILSHSPNSTGVSGPASDPSSTPGVASVTLEMELRVKVGSSGVLFFLASWLWQPGSKSTLEAHLWTSPDISSQLSPGQFYPGKLLPEYEPFGIILEPITRQENEVWPLPLDLSMIGGLNDLPSDLPSKISQVRLLIGKGGIAFWGTIIASPPPPTAQVPAIPLGELDLSVSYLWKPSTSVEVSLRVETILSPPPDVTGTLPASVVGDISFANGQWKLDASLTGAYGSTLYEVFDTGSRQAVGSILNDIFIETLNIHYDYASHGGATQFSMNGILLLGFLRLTLDFENSLGRWSFNAFLDMDTESDPTTVGQITASIFGDEVEVPDFVKGIEVIPPKTKDAVGLKIDSNPLDKSVFFTAWVNFGEQEELSFQAIQYHPAGAQALPRRVFMVSMDQLPSVNVDLIGNLGQPFDEMLFVYVQPQTSDGQNDGITWGEMNSINQKQKDLKKKELLFRVTKKSPLDYRDTDIVLEAGLHFILVLKNELGVPTVVLDYVFGKPSSSASPKSLSTDSATSSDNPGSAKAPYPKKVGPLAIENMGLEYTSGPASASTLSVLVDGFVALGPIKLGLVGFSLNLVFDSGKTLANLPTPTFSLHGLALTFDRAPIVLAGFLEHVTSVDPQTSVNAYEGALTINYKPWLFEAAGYYGLVTTKTLSFRSVFVYFVLNGPLVSFELAEIDGVTGGFGFNTNLRFPDINNVVQFPFLQNSDFSDPSSALDFLISGDWFFPQPGSFWLAAGLSVFAFEILRVKAVMVVKWDPKVQLGVFGVATGDMPANVPQEKKFAHVELGLISTIDLESGTLKIDGQLSPSSFVINPSCHLTGGFALYRWSGGEGDDWVFTIGGYHRSYQPPSQYPNPPRLAISWSYDAALSIRGEAYFAVTPKVCMGGGRLDACLSLGPLEAFFDAYADFLINYMPFHFMAEGGLSVGVRFTLNLWICSIHINVEIGATLFLQGPPMSGRVHVNFWLMGFDVDFGTVDEYSNTGLSLEDFFQLTLQSALPRSLAPAANDAGPQAHVFSCNNGLMPSGTDKSTPNSTVWNVRGGAFEFTVTCKFSINYANIVTGQVDGSMPPVHVQPVLGNNVHIHARPMKQPEELTSQLNVTIRPDVPSANDTSSIPLWTKASLIIKSMPTALWGDYNPTSDPSSPSNPVPNRTSSLLNAADASIPLPMGVTVSSPLPIISPDNIPAFEYRNFFNEDAGTSLFPGIWPDPESWNPEPLSTGPWETVRGHWSGTPSLGAGAAEKVVQTWASLDFCQWDASTVTSVSGKPPETLLTEDLFDSMYLEAPRLGVNK